MTQKTEDEVTNIITADGEDLIEMLVAVSAALYLVVQHQRLVSGRDGSTEDVGADPIP